MPKKQLVAIDMDGTLLKTDETLSDRTIKTIKKATAQGVQIVLATGRPLTGVEPYLKQLDLWRPGHYSLTLNGATVQENATNKRVEHFSMNYTAVRTFYTLAQKNGWDFHVQDNHQLYVLTPKISQYSKSEAAQTNQKIKVTNINDILHLGYFHKVQVLGSAQQMDQAMAEMPKILEEQYAIVRQIPQALDIMSVEAGKANALMGISYELGIPITQTVAIGDGGNDVSMFRNAELAVAMGNAGDPVKHHADVITDTNDRDGVAKAIEKYVLDD